MNRLFFASFLLLFLFACKHSKQVTQGGKIEESNTKQLYKKMLEQNIDFTYLQAKAKMSYDDGKNRQSFAANFSV
ncbi:MAG: hypothetical protein LRY27_00110 [Chitinophagales bacterium]|nr:hypothetical protein [Chitinophagales bacterium]